MPIYLGNNELAAIRKGNDTISKVFVGDTQVYPNQAPYINISPLSRNLTSTITTTYDIQVSSNIAWIANETLTWLSLSKTSGAGDDTVTVIVDENIQQGGSRQATIKFLNNNYEIEKTHTLTQPGRAFEQAGLRTGDSMQDACNAPVGSISFYTDTADFENATVMWSSPERTFSAPPGWYASPDRSIVRLYNGGFLQTGSCI